MKSASGRKHRSRRSKARPVYREGFIPRSLVPVLIAYSDIPSARHAMARLTQLLQLTGGTLQPMLWRFDQLKEDRWREMALRDARQASTVAFAVPNESALEHAPERWLLALLERVRGTSVSLLALIGNDEAWTLTFEQSMTRTLSCSRPVPPPRVPTRTRFASPPVAVGA